MYFLLKLGIFQPAMLVYQRAVKQFDLQGWLNRQLVSDNDPLQKNSANVKRTSGRIEIKNQDS